MSFTCLDPYIAVNLFTKLDGKNIIKLFSKKRLDYNIDDLKQEYGADNVYVLPCGKCESCKRNRAEDWAIRCELEAKEHPFNYFLTLTFDNQHIDKASEKDLRHFLDLLAGWNNCNKYKYFACEELGELTQRLHFHLVLFCDFELDLYNPVKLNGFYHFHSKKIDEFWTLGLHDITPFGVNCARYVAKYTSKDSKLFMSRNLGKSYFLKHYKEIIEDGFKVYSNFGGRFNSKIPKCFEKWFSEIDPSLIDVYKSNAKKIAHYVEAEEMRSQKILHHDEALFSRQHRVIEKGEKKRKL